VKSNLLSIEYERIKDLTAQLDKNPKNIFALKELADIYLLQEDYNKAVGLYEMLVASKPSVETEKLKNAESISDFDTKERRSLLETPFF